MKRTTFFLALLATVGSTAHAAEPTESEPEAQSITFNVFLNNWQVLGPFPLPLPHDNSNSGLEVKYVDDEASLREGHVSFFENQLYLWRSWPEGFIDFKKALNARNTKGDYKVGYAYTTFRSDKATKATLSLGYDDTIIAWLNGKKVAQEADRWFPYLDQTVESVQLKAGVNTLLVKVGQGYGAWGVSARFLPTDVDTPPLKFYLSPAGYSNLERLPVVDVEFLDANEKLLSRHQCSGLREKEGKAGFYALHAPHPAETKWVRYLLNADGFAHVERRLSLKAAITKRVVLNAGPDKPTPVLIADGSSGIVINSSEIWTKKERVKTVKLPTGVTAEFNPLANSFVVAAKGYEPETVKLQWPRPEQVTAVLQRGGKSLTGIVVDSAGAPIAGATIESELSGPYSPTATSDENGRFELFLPASQSYLHPTVSCDGYVTKARFRQNLYSSVTDVEWSLKTSSILTGRVTDADGQPVPGVVVVSGESRFGGRQNPQTTTDADGNYRLTNVAPGDVTLHALSDNHAPKKSNLTLTSGKPAAANFQLELGRSVTGVILDVEGEPISRVRVITDTWNNSRMFEREAYTNERGEFTLAHMPESEAEADVLKQGFIHHRDVKVKGGDAIKLTMKPELVYTFTIRTEDKKSLVPNLQILMGNDYGNNNWNWQSQSYYTTDRYNKSTGVMTVTVDEPVRSKTAYQFKAAGLAAQTIELPMEAIKGKSFDVFLKAAKVFRGRVVDQKTGEPLANAAVSILDESGSRSSHWTDYHTPWQYIQDSNYGHQKTLTDSRGEFVLTDPGADGSAC